MMTAKQLTAPSSGPSLLDAVFGEERRKAGSFGRRLALPFGLVVAFGAHAALYFVARSKEPSLETWTANMAALVHADLVKSGPTEVESEVSPRSEPPHELSIPLEVEPEDSPSVASLPKETAAVEPPSAAEQSAHAHETEASVEASASPAQAGELIAADEPSGPVDLTENAFVTGRASAYIGGATASSGAGNKARKLSEVEREGTSSPAKSGAPTNKQPSKARSVQLPNGRWSCDWPKTALDQDIYEQYVVLRVHVRSDGTADDVRLQNDPGNGFGAAAIACARSTRFVPALDEAGKAVAATSPPIRVRFTR